ncbi:MAG TPA: hypothetical protein VLL94_06990 [Nitrospiraceae bacterium]|nr:hypothetical protein [Nitrospiraceae bacterium]
MIIDAIPHQVLRTDGATETNSIDAFTNLKAFLTFRKTLEGVLGLQAYRCPYLLSGTTPRVEVCALNDLQEEKILKGE